MALVVVGTVAEFAESVEEHGAGERISCFPFIQAGLHASAELGVLHPVESKEGAFESAELPQGCSQTVLPRVAAQLPEHQRCGDGAGLDRGGEAQNIVPVGVDDFGIDVAADQRLQGRIAVGLSGNVETFIGQAADARGEPVAEEVGECEDVVREAGGVLSVTLNDDGGVIVFDDGFGGVVGTVTW